MPRKSWHQVDITEKQDTEVVEKFGGPCRGRTYGPLIKSEAEGVAQVFDDMSNPLVALGDPRRGSLSHLVSLSPT